MAYVVDINPDDPKSIDAALRTEWLLTNGLGGYAMGTVLGVNTRRYHGLLVAATKPPVGRAVALHSIIEQLIVPREDGTEEVIDLSTQQFVGGDGQPMLHPQGWRWLRTFSISNQFCHWTWKVADLQVRKSLAPNTNAVENDFTIRYQFIGRAPKDANFRIRPLISLRDFHALNSSMISGRTDRCSAGVIFECNGSQLRFNTSLPFRESAQVWRRLAYSRDLQRGQDWIEDLSTPGTFECQASTDSLIYISATVPTPKRAAADSVLLYLATSNEPHQLLRAAADQFVVFRRFDDLVHRTVIAGYPWFGDWGRDTMIALPGLMLCTGRLDEARSTLECFAKHLRNGLIPNLFDDYGGAAHYNTVDASLWFVHAVHALWRAHGVRADGPKPDCRSLSAACREIIAAYRRGTDFNIRIDADGLIVAGDESTQLTWMDAKRDGVVFTPRHGKAVEINALWHNALLCMSEMTDNANERNELLTLARQVAASFRSAFWWEERQCLHDCLAPVGSDATSRDARFANDGHLRPNQILAVSLPFSPLNEMQQRAVVKIVGERLLTPFGLRTLDREDPNYKPRYEGNLFQRDAAYHNGTVWPWLIGPYCEALLRIDKFSDAAKQRVRQLLRPLIDEMSNASGGRCLGQIAEVYDGDPPHRPSGCPAQAWSVAEVLRLLTLVS